MKRICSWLLTIVLVLGLCACGQQGGGAGGDDWQSQYDLGVRYLSEGNYEEAIIAFTAAIEIDPKRPEAYVGRGGAYIGSGETASSAMAGCTPSTAPERTQFIHSMPGVGAMTVAA